jgi:hypothetical protein
MSPAEAARDLLEQRKVQDLPPKVADPAVVRRLAALFGADQQEPAPFEQVSRTGRAP